jgi:signal transduction histidine kinase
MPMRRQGRWSWGVSARSALVAATVVFVALTAAGAILAVVLYRSMLSGIDDTAAARVGQLAASLETSGAAGVDPDLLSTDERILAVQVITPEGTVVRRSRSAPDTPMVPISEIGDGLHIGMPEHDSPYGQIRFSAQTVDGPGGRYTVLVGEGSQVVFATVKAVVIALALAAPIVVAVSAAMTYLLVSRSMRSVDAIRTRVAEISTSDLTERVPVPEKRDEISALALTMNEMLARIEAGHSAQQRFVGDASHELRTPLTAIRGNVDVLLRQARLDGRRLDPTDLTSALDDVRRESDRMRRLLDDLLLLARADADAGKDPTGTAPIHRDWVRLDEIAAEAVRSAEALASGQVLELEAPRSVEVPGDPNRLHQLLMILLDNAIRHTPPGGRIRVAVAATPDGRARVAVRDEGEGIAPEHLPHLFERFYRADGARGRSSGGTGLGLAIAQAICRAHGGEISVISAPDQGATFLVTLPGGAHADAGDHSSTQPAEAADGRDQVEKSGYGRSRISAAIAPPTRITNAIGTTSPRMDSRRNPRP